MKKLDPGVNDSKPLWFMLFGFTGLGLLLAYMLRNADILLLNPKGLIAAQERDLLLLITGILLLIAVPSLFLFYYYAWKYRETNEKAAYEPSPRHGKIFMFSIWAIPIVFMVVLAPLLWFSTHRLAPQKAIASPTKPITIQVIALRWKWLFIYPEQKIATVNFVQMPVGTPVRFELTADEVSMSSFWIPQLSGQLYAMTGHVNRLNMMATTPGDYQGSSAEINGAGFAGMKFIARATSKAEFDVWAGSVRQNFVPLDSPNYEKLLKPSERHPYEYFSTPEAELYDKVVMKYMKKHAPNNPQAADNKMEKL